MYHPNLISRLRQMKNFSRAELHSAINATWYQKSEASFKVQLQKMLKEGQIIRVGRNLYTLNEDGKKIYDASYSDLAENIAQIIQNNHPDLDFTIFEMVQLNEFVDHPIAHNVVFVSVKRDFEKVIFDILKTEYPGKVLISPSVDTYNQNRSDQMIVLLRLKSGAPKADEKPWHTKIEKLLVDIMTEQLLIESISESEYPRIFENAFSKYVINESKMFRYARCRSAEDRIKRFIQEKTDVELRTVQYALTKKPHSKGY